MRSFWTALFAASLVSCALIGFVGCGGGTEETSTTETQQTGAPETTKSEGGETQQQDGQQEEQAAAEGWGTIKGVVIYKGEPPEPKVLVKEGDTTVKDPEVCAKHTITSEELVVNKENKGIQWAVVFVNRPAKIHPDLQSPPEEPAILDQIGCVYVPHVLAIREGQKLIVASQDPISHNTNIQGFRNTPWNRVLPPAEGMQTRLDGPSLVAEPLPMPVACNIHPWMKAYIAVFNHPYFAVTNEKGEFTIEKVPAGTVHLVSWQEKFGRGPGGRSGIAVEVKPGETTEVTIEFPAN